MTDLLRAADAAVASGQPALAVSRLRQLFEEKPALSTAMAVSQRVAKLGLPLRSLRVLFLRTFTVEPVFPLLRARALLEGLDLQLKAGPFGAIAQEALDPASETYRFDPQIIFVALQSRDFVPDLWRGARDPAAIVTAASAQLRQWLTRLREGTRATLVVQSLESPAWPASGVLDAQTEGQMEAFALLTAELRRVARACGAFVLDYDALVARHGRDRWHDERKWLTARMPVAAEFLTALADEYLRFVLPIAGAVRKVLVLDLDNTLWGGVVGEDGKDGLRLGPEYPGAAFVALQRALLDLHERGVLLAIASKNNPADALEIIEKHPAMLLRPRHLAALRINWNDKAVSLREIARELNVGLDSLVFLDDNPMERERVRTEAPEVLVLEPTTDPMGYAQLVARCPSLQRLSLTAEDRARSQQYVEQRERAQLQDQAGSLEEFYRSLEMTVAISPMTPATRARVAQLTQKTNQFNTTTRRYTEAEIDALVAAGARVFTYGVRDRFGDNGLVGVVIAKSAAGAWELDTFLLSCRVIGRTVETAILAHVARAALAAGASSVCGWILATPKNEPARDVYRVHGFRAVEARGLDHRWELDLESAPRTPEWIAVEEE